MKAIKFLNALAIGLPIVFGLLGFVWAGAWLIATLSLMLTGLLQVILAILYWKENLENIPIKIYLAGVGLFFALWFGFGTDIDIILLIFPPAWCLFLCWIIYTHKTVEDENK